MDYTGYFLEHIWEKLHLLPLKATDESIKIKGIFQQVHD